MEKLTYYVSVQAGTILEEQGDAAYEFVIQATPKEADQLQELLDLKQESEDETFWRGIMPAVPYHEDQANDEYDDSLRGVFERVYRLGTQQTKEFMEQSGMIH